MSNRATTIRILLVDGDPDGFRIVEKTGWVGQGLVSSRPGYREARSHSEFDGPGVYVLVSNGEEESVKRQLYVGEAENLRKRLDRQLQDKDFWNQVIAFSSKDETLNKANVRYLESQLVGLARTAKTWRVLNSNSPSIPTLSRADTADVDSFLEEMLILYPILGVDAFEAPTPSDGCFLEFKITGPDASGIGIDANDGFVVRQGARARISETDTIGQPLSTYRARLVEEGVLAPYDSVSYKLTQDFRFSSPSTAASVLLGRRANGRTEWRTQDGRTLRDVQEQAID